MSFMPELGSIVRLTDRRCGVVSRVTPLGGDDRVTLGDGTERRVQADDIAEVLDGPRETGSETWTLDSRLEKLGGRIVITHIGEWRDGDIDISLIAPQGHSTAVRFPRKQAGEIGRELTGPSYPMTPVDCLLAELCEHYGWGYSGVLTKEAFEERVAQFRDEVSTEADSPPTPESDRPVPQEQQP